MNLINKWSEGQHINLSREILGKITTPNIQTLKDFWGMLHAYVHSTKYAQQVSLDLDNNLYEIEFNFVFIQILLECFYHLLNRHLINPSVVYYANLYGRHKEGIRLKKRDTSVVFKIKKGIAAATKEVYLHL